MKFPWHKYKELPLSRRATLQVFISNNCNLKCKGCFARNAMSLTKGDISIEEYTKAIEYFTNKKGKQVNLLGGEPMLHPKLEEIIAINELNNLKTTIYTNGKNLDNFNKEDLGNAKLRVAIYGIQGNKGVVGLPETNLPFDSNFMVSSKTTVDDLIQVASYMEEHYNTNVFFISSLRELDNPEKEFFYDTEMCKPVLLYKKLVHEFLYEYEGNMDIHISKRGVFESTATMAANKCNFANYFIGNKIIQCPYDVVNLKFQEDYDFGERHCQQNNTCLMSKIILRRITKDTK